MSAPKRDACTFVTRNPSGSSRINRNPLANFEETLPRIPLQKFEPVSKVVDGEVIGAQPFGEFAPSEGRRDGCWQQCAGRIRGHRCRTAVVAQVVDENASTPDTLRNGGDIAVGAVSRHRLRERGGERFRFVPTDQWLDRNHDMEPLAARCLDEAFQTASLKPVAKLFCRLNNPRDWAARPSSAESNSRMRSHRVAKHRRGTARLAEPVRAATVSQVLIAGPSLEKESLRRALRNCSDYNTRRECSGDVIGTVFDVFAELGVKDSPVFGIKCATINGRSLKSAIAACCTVGKPHNITNQRSQILKGTFPF